MLVKEESSQCSGCTACYSICPVKAIRMIEDEEGFLYPDIDEKKCIHCDKCKKVCPFQEDYEELLGISGEKIPEANHRKRFWSVKHVENEVCKNSRSGGFFYAAAEIILKRGGVVYGVNLNDCQEAEFIRIERTEDLKSLQGSKYVQASKNDSFKNVADDLRHGKEVLYAGVSCETAGLRSYIQLSHISDENLYTIDIICHGVPSPKIWRENLAYLENKWNTKIISANFRDKSLGWKSHIESYQCMDGPDEGSCKKRYANRYTSLFYAHVIHRPSCHNCRFCNYNRTGDITAGDFWGSLRDPDKSLRKYTGTSQIMINSEKGMRLFEQIQDMEKHEIAKEAFSYQPNLFKPTPRSESRDEFWTEYKKMGYAKASRKYLTISERLKIPYNLIKNRNKG